MSSLPPVSARDRRLAVDLVLLAADSDTAERWLRVVLGEEPRDVFWTRPSHFRGVPLRLPPICDRRRADAAMARDGAFVEAAIIDVQRRCFDPTEVAMGGVEGPSVRAMSGEAALLILPAPDGGLRVVEHTERRRTAPP